MNCICYLTKDKGEVSSGIVQRAAFSCDTERLTRSPTAEQVRSLDFAIEDALGKRCHVSEVRNIWEVMC